MKTILTILAVAFLTITLFAQSPEKISYQAVIRNSNNQLIANKHVGMKISILKNSVTGSVVYAETQQPSTNANGLISIQIGNGTNVSGSFSGIDWSGGTFYIKTETDPAGGTNYTITGTSQILSVPYALYAKEAGSVAISGNESTFNSWDKNSDNDVTITTTQEITGDKTFKSTIKANGIALPYTFGPDTNYVGTKGAFIGFGHSEVSEDFIGYKNNRFYFKDSPGGGDVSDPDVIIGGKVGIGVETPNEKLEVDGNINLHGNTLKNLADPINNQDAATKAYVDANGGFRGDYNDLENKPDITTSPNIKIGVGAGQNTPDDREILAIGDSTLYNNGIGGYNNNQATANTAIGSKALYSNTNGYSNTANGYRALYYNNTGRLNNAYGTEALYSNTTGYSNLANGYHALYYNTEGCLNIAHGTGALYSNTTGSWNIANGNYALYSNTTGSWNTVNGGQALYCNTTGYYNTANGYWALHSNKSGDFNTASGDRALYNNTSGAYNTAVGDHTIFFNISGDYNTAIGFDAGPASENTDLSNTGAFGNGAKVTANNTICIGNSTITRIGGYTEWSILSDGRFKTNIEKNVPGIKFIMKLIPVTFTWDMDKLDAFTGVNDSIYLNCPDMKKARDKKETKRYTGFIAQEVEAAADSCGFDFSGVLVPENDKTPYNLSYAEFVVPLVKAVQEQQKTIELLQQQNNEMQQEIQQLKDILNTNQ